VVTGAVERVARHVVDRFGGLHIAVNNAGIVNGGRTWELSLDDWHHVIDVNLWGVIHGIRSFVPRILDTGDEGHVVNTGSTTVAANVLDAIRRQRPYVFTDDHSTRAGVIG